jgi:hypothetical protein
MSSIKYILNNYKQYCPYCRTRINKKDLRKIFKKIVCLNIKPTDLNEWTYENTKIKLHKIKIKKRFKINVDEYTNFFLPSYKKNKILFLISPKILNLNKIFIDNLMIFSRQYKDKYTEYNEDLPIYKLALDGLIETKEWNKYMKKNFNINIKSDLNYHYNFSKYKIRFYIKNIKNITTYDIQYGEMIKGLILKPNRTCKILFKTYYIYHKNNIFLVNEMFAIMYD